MPINKIVSVKVFPCQLWVLLFKAANTLTQIQCADNRMPISYVGKGRTFTYFSYYDVVNQKVDGAAFKNKIVLVAFTASGVRLLPRAGAPEKP